MAQLKFYDDEIPRVKLKIYFKKKVEMKMKKITVVPQLLYPLSYCNRTSESVLATRKEVISLLAHRVSVVRSME